MVYVCQSQRGRSEIEVGSRGNLVCENERESLEGKRWLNVECSGRKKGL